jgi:hypothetical protein
MCGLYPASGLTAKRAIGAVGKVGVGVAGRYNLGLDGREIMADNKGKPKKGGAGSVVKVVLLLVVVALVAGIGYGFTLEAKPRFERSIVIKASPEDVHEWTGDLKKWDEWGPWREDYPEIKYTYSEKTDEVGSKQTFVTSDGTGSMTITKTDPKKGMWYKFTWDDHPETEGFVSYTELEDGNTKVTWVMDASDAGMNIPMRYMMHFMRGAMEEMFQKGLDKLKVKVEES